MANPIKHLGVNSRRLLGIGIIIVSMVGVLWPTRLLAASSMSYSGVTVAPAIFNLDIQKDQVRVPFTITLTNNTESPVTLTISSVDFKSLNSTGGVAFIGNDATQVAHKYGLASWLNVSGGLIELNPHQSKPVALAVENRNDLSPGGHYAAVLFKAVNRSSATAVNHVMVNEVISALIFVRKINGEQYGINLSKFSLPISWLHLPANVDLFFHNTGNVQEVPHGLVTISAPFSREVARGLVNSDSSLVLPEDQRLFRTSLLMTAHAWLPGRYTLRVSYHSDGLSALRTARTSFWYVNLPLVGEGLLSIGVIWLVVHKLRTTYRHKRVRRNRRRNRST